MKILIAYATRFGTTEKCAGMLADILKEKGYEVELVDLAKNKKINPRNYDLAVVGGSFVVFRMSSAVRRFVKRNLNTLLNMKTGIFMCGAEQEWEKEIVKGFPEKLLDSTAVKGYFGFEMNWDRMNPMFRNMMQKAYQTTKPVSKINHENIRKFAEEIMKALS